MVDEDEVLRDDGGDEARNGEGERRHAVADVEKGPPHAERPESTSTAVKETTKLSFAATTDTTKTTKTTTTAVTTITTTATTMTATSRTTTTAATTTTTPPAKITTTAATSTMAVKDRLEFRSAATKATKILTVRNHVHMLLTLRRRLGDGDRTGVRPGRKGREGLRCAGDGQETSWVGATRGCAC